MELILMEALMFREIFPVTVKEFVQVVFYEVDLTFDFESFFGP